MDPFQLDEHAVKKIPTIETKSKRKPKGTSDPDTWDVNAFSKKLKVKIISLDDLNIEFDLTDICVPFVNAFRRVLLAEVPTMAIEKVHVYNNTSIMQDEVLAHRLGLIPLKADPRQFAVKNFDDENRATPKDCLEFELKVTCKKADKASQKSGGDDTRKKMKNSEVYSGQIKWIPIGDQSTKFKAEDVGPVNDDILIAKLRPGHELDLKLIASKGIGKDHAKFQPVATASFRLLPHIILTQEVEGEKAQRLKSCFSPGVIELKKDRGKLKATVVNARNDTCSRNVYRYDDLKDCVQISRVPDHYIFTIESVGSLPPDVLFLEAVGVLKDKCDRLLKEFKVKGKTSFS